MAFRQDIDVNHPSGGH